MIGIGGVIGRFFFMVTTKKGETKNVSKHSKTVLVVVERGGNG